MTTYKRLGDYIREVNVRNQNLKVMNLLGVNLSKQFFPSIANIIGTDLSKYKIIEKGQFGCKFMSVGRDGILPISLMQDDKPAIISSAYYVFEVKDQEVLLPEYLINLNIDLISKFVIPLPPYNEQVEIVAFIDEIIPQIDSLIALKQAKIEELKEYKKSVIYEYVTGKKEVA